MSVTIMICEDIVKISYSWQCWEDKSARQRGRGRGTWGRTQPGKPCKCFVKYQCVCVCGGRGVFHCNYESPEYFLLLVYQAPIFFEFQRYRKHKRSLNLHFHRDDCDLLMKKVFNDTKVYFIRSFINPVIQTSLNLELYLKLKSSFLSW